MSINLAVLIYILTGRALHPGLAMSNFCFNYLTLILYCIVFGVTYGAYVGLESVILIDVIGLRSFIQGYGIQMFFEGLGLVIGPPIIGNGHI